MFIRSQPKRVTIEDLFKNGGKFTLKSNKPLNQTILNRADNEYMIKL